MNNSIKEAKRTLINNRRLNYTLPTNTKLYPAQWNWDSAFIALGYSNFNLDYSFKELETLISGQWDDGMIPHILFHIKDLNYTPNYKAWNCGKKVSSSGITQPPILASILRIIIERQKFSKKEIKKYQPLILKIKKCLEWFIRYRDPKRTGLISILHPWESGYDNSPLWDKPMSKIKTELNLKYKRKDNKIVNQSQRPLKIDYDRYVTIKNHLKEMNYDPKKLYFKSKFNVVDVGFNSLFLKALKDVDFLLRCIDKRNSFIKKYILLNESKLIKLFDSKKMTFKNKDIRNNSLVAIPSITNFFMLFADLNNNLINRNLIKSLKIYYKKSEKKLKLFLFFSKNKFSEKAKSDFIKNNYANFKLENTVYLINENGGFLKMSKAIKYCINFIEMNFILKFFIKITPAFILDIIYRLIARCRYVMFGKKSICSFPDGLHTKQILK